MSSALNIQKSQGQNKQFEYTNQPARGRGNTAKSSQSWATDDDGVDIDELNDRMQSFSQDLLELAAIKSNLPQFKQRIAMFVEKRTTVMVMLNRLAKNMAPNDAALYGMTEKFKRSVKQHELRARNICVNIQQEKGNEVRIIEFFDDQIKKYEFQLGITPGILEQSLVRENQQLQEQLEARPTRPNIDEHVDTLDLGTAPVPDFKPPRANNIGNNPGQTFDQNQTIKLGHDETMFSGKIKQGPKGGAEMTMDANDTIAHVLATMKKEDNDRSETGGDDYMNEDFLRDKRAANMDIGGPGGTGSSSTNYQNMQRSSANNPNGAQTIKIQSYMHAQNEDMNISSASRKRKQQQLENAVPVTESKGACRDCTIF